LTRQETPEKAARRRIDAALEAAGWLVQSKDAVNLHAGRAVGVREFRLKSGHGYADYLLYVDGQAVGVIEAKKEGEILTGVEVQAEKYSAGMPNDLPTPIGGCRSCSNQPALRRDSRTASIRHHEVARRLRS
jgi:type I restriction enzyme R subunit